MPEINVNVSFKKIEEIAKATMYFRQKNDGGVHGGDVFQAFRP